MAEEARMSVARSFSWGFIAYIIGMLLANLIPIPFMLYISPVLFYVFYLKKRRVRLGYYIVGFFLFAVLFAALIGAVIFAALFGA